WVKPLAEFALDEPRLKKRAESLRLQLRVHFHRVVLTVIQDEERFGRDEIAAVRSLIPRRSAANSLDGQCRAVIGNAVVSRKSVQQRRAVRQVRPARIDRKAESHLRENNR